MEKFQQEFIEFLITNQALQFGDFTLKSGRKSPYFINTGVFESGESIKQLGYFYAALIKQEFGDNFDLIFGPAYKGIPLCVTTSIALANDFKLDKFYAFNRKEVKDHGDKKMILGHQLKDGEKIILIDDVITDGATKFETVEMLNNIAKIEYTGLVVAVNRMEKTADGLDAFKNIEDKLHFPVKAIVSVREIIDYLTDKEINGQVYLTSSKAEEMEQYLKEFGI
ncbi:MAG: orotate phosphoribosyltransferase [Candidatus Komeilibacteria bacterium]|nr:orotate phosphoribosyltransferase [Candidatus Komeilibacteria bacterium]